MKQVRVVLKPGREKPLEGRHPWVFSGAVDMIDDNHEAGDVVDIISSKGKFLAKGHLSTDSEIAVRVLTYEDEPIGRDFFRKRIRQAAELRKAHFDGSTDSYRLINSEGDFLPGLIVDRYGECLVSQVHTLGMEKSLKEWVEVLAEETKAKGVYRKDEDAASFQTLSGGEAPRQLEIKENGIRFFVDPRGGQKTGFFLDQRDNRNRTKTAAKDKKVLNAFCYTGGFSVYAALGGAAHVTSVDSSQPALDLCAENFKLNGLEPARHALVREDVFQFFRRNEETYDLIILDPPAFAKSKSQIMPATRGYKDINLWALRRLAPGGLLFTFSCSSYISADLFQKVLFAAAKDGRRNLQMLAKTAHAPDHPVSIYHPEGEYLKGILCRAVD